MKLVSSLLFESNETFLFCYLAGTVITVYYEDDEEFLQEIEASQIELFEYKNRNYLLYPWKNKYQK
jgi:hypothetical protein